MHNYEHHVLANELLIIYEQEMSNSFPYEDCRKLLQLYPEFNNDLIPDLDLYFYEVASHCGGIKEIIKWKEKDKIERAKNMLAKSFFEKHNEYKVLESSINQSNTPLLFKRMALYEKIRMGVLGLLNKKLNDFSTNLDLG